MIAWWLGGELGAAGELQWLAPQWLVIVSVVSAAIALGLAWIGARPVLARVGEVLLWAGALAAVVVAIARPVWVEEQGRTEPGRVAVLVDASRSMSILEDGTPRAAQIEAILGRVSGPDVDLYHFGDELLVGGATGYDLPGTDVEGALVALEERVAGEKLAGVVLLSDGLDRGLARRRFRRDAEPRPVAPVGPLTVYQVGSPQDLKDLSVRNLEGGGFAFQGEEFTLSALVEGLGHAGETVPVTLSKDGNVVTVVRTTLDESGQAEVPFTLQPTKPGRFTYEVSVPLWEDDAVPGNNSAALVVRIVREEIRVLQVAGAPTWDVKFLRRFLKGDPSVDLVSFFILRTNEDLDAGYQPDELSLIAFPYTDLFEDQLENFDLVIFQDFDYFPYFERSANRFLENIRRYVEDDGRAFVMVGGDRSYDLGRYAKTPIENLLPVRMGLPGERPVDLSRFQPGLTAEGRRHPVTRLVADPLENEAWWGRLPPLDGTNLVRRAAPDATVLLTHPTRKGDDGAPMPVLSVREAGRGRSMALTVDSSWRWSFAEAAEGRGNQAYLRFWKNAFRWLLDEPSTRRVTADTARENYAVGDEVRVIVRARDPGFAPLPGATVKATITTPGGTLEREGVTGRDGEVVLEVPAERRGAHRVQVEVAREGQAVGAADTVFAVTTRDPELDEVQPDAAFLQWLANSTGGRYYGPGERGPIVRNPEAGRTVFDRRETPLSHAPLLGLLALLFSGLAWTVRRRAGLR